MTSGSTKEKVFKYKDENKFKVGIEKRYSMLTVIKRFQSEEYYHERRG